jgi:hypothetical protein
VTGVNRDSDVALRQHLRPAVAWPVDTLSGFEGVNRLTGGMGNDLFRVSRSAFGESQAIITDFTKRAGNTDGIVFVAGITAAELTYTQMSNGVMNSIANDGFPAASVFIQNATLPMLNGSIYFE